MSAAVLTDTIPSPGIMICFYYGLTAIGCVWYFRRESFSSNRLWIVFFITLRDSASPDDDGTGVSIFGVGVVLVLGLGPILLGVVIMLIMRVLQPAFFRGETLRRDTRRWSSRSR